jgi:hypothetical protein
MQFLDVPSLIKDKLATRFAAPARVLAFSPSGATLAAGSDDLNIKLVNVADSRASIDAVFRGEGRMLRVLCALVRVLQHAATW